MAAERDQPVVGVAGAHRRLDQDREQRLAVEPGRERVADPARRHLDLDPLTAQLVHLIGEPPLILLNSLASPAISSPPLTGTRCEKSPSPMRRAAPSISRT